jgi:hypothetical protein
MMAALALAAGLVVVPVAGAASAAAPTTFTVQAERGQVARAASSLGRGAIRVQRRRGPQLQVTADRAQARALARLPGVAGVRPAVTAFSDAALSQGVERSGADVLGRVAGGGAGLTIAIVDMGFGQNIETLQGKDELPQPGRLETLTFDTVSGLAGTNAYGNRTNHGELVAQTAYDYAPAARYLFVNYHSEADFIAAADAVTARRPDIVVHSNSFIEGPFDGTSPAAQAVDRAAAAGILWINSAGNYARLHWSGPWANADADGDLDWPNGDSWTFTRGAGLPITFALSWTPPAAGPATDIDLALERLEADGAWTVVARSTDRQSEGARAAERIVGYQPPAEGFFRLRAILVSGPPPEGPLTLFSREIPLAPISGTIESSLPTPGDALGAVAVGAVDWRGNRFKSYSSQGPTDDGRLKPDIVAPTDTRLMGPNGFRSIGGTSNAAPNAAGVAAVILAAARRAGQAPSAVEVRGQLSALALDLGAPGPDNVFGAGRVRASVDPPRLGRLSPAPKSSVRGRVTVRFTARSRSRVTHWSLDVDGVPAVRRLQPYPRGITIDTRRLPDGFHALSVDARDFPGNEGRRAWAVRVDNTRPTLVVRRLVVSRPRGAGAAERPRAVAMVVAAADPGSGAPLEVTAAVRDRAGHSVSARSSRVRPGALRRVALGTFRRGRYRVILRLSDRAGNAVTVTRRILVR